MAAEIRILRAGDEHVLANVAEGVFDHPVRAELLTEFLSDARHHLAVAVEEQLVVGFASCVHYVHPDKLPELWVNEVGVAPTHQRRGLGRRMLQALFDEARARGCVLAWVLTDRDNAPAMSLYASLGGIEDPGDTVLYELRLVRGS